MLQLRHAERRKTSIQRLSDLTSGLSDAESKLGNDACVYAIGSFGRCEASPCSDLDLFIVSKSECNFSKLDEICVKADLIRTAQSFDFPEFDSDGEYLKRYTAGELKKNIGMPEDDAVNTFTARVLLLLESRPVIGGVFYEEVVKEVIEAYWTNFERHQTDFVPGYLINDILRLWRTFCVNYEARTESTTDKKIIKRRMKHYTLKHSRMLTCFSALTYFLFEFGKNRTITQEAAFQMVMRTPIERLEFLQDTVSNAARRSIDTLLASYERFLIRKENKEELTKLFAGEQTAHQITKEADEFGEAFFEAINTIGMSSKLHRMIVV